jgi:hypothetical protein
MMRGTLGLTVVGVLVLAGCTGDPAPRGTVGPGVTVSPSAVPSVTATAAAPVRPVDEATPGGAGQFVTFFWETYNYAYRNLDPDAIARISEPGCKFCASAIQEIRELRDSGSVLDGFEVHVDNSATASTDASVGVIVVSTISQTPGRTTKNGKVRHLEGIRNMRSTVGVARANSRWIIAGVNNDTDSGKPWT